MYNFDIYIHTNLKNYVPAMVGKYSFEKLNSSIKVFVEILENYENLIKNNNSIFYRNNNQLQWNITKSQSFFPLRFLCIETHNKRKINDSNLKKWILIVDPDIFCVKNLQILNQYIEQAEQSNLNIIACRKQLNLFNSSFMLVNSDEINWNENYLIEDVFVNKNDFDNWMFLKSHSVLEIPDIFNCYDEIKNDTCVLHTTRTETQPWKSGILYKESDLHNKISNLLEKKNKKFREHPNQNVKDYVFGLFKEAYDLNYITNENIDIGIQTEGLRNDIRLKCNILL